MNQYKKQNPLKMRGFCFKVPRAGVEPARPRALVFETNASTNSAIWAKCSLRTKRSPKLSILFKITLFFVGIFLCLEMASVNKKSHQI